MTISWYCRGPTSMSRWYSLPAQVRKTQRRQFHNNTSLASLCLIEITICSLSPPPSSTPEKVGIQAKRKQTMKNDNNNGDRRGWKWERARGSKQYAASWRCKTFTALPLLISCGVLQFFIPLIKHVNITLAVVQYSFEWWCNSEQNNSRGSAGTDVYSGCLDAVNIPHVSYWLPYALYEKSILNKLVICWTGQDLGLCE